MGNCFIQSDINTNGTINVDIKNNLLHKPTNQNNDECSILISSYSNEQNYSVKYKESNIKGIYEKNKENNSPKIKNKV